MISFVNGFLCTCSCDVSKAKRGVDPHPKTDDLQGTKKPNETNGMPATDDPAVVFGGSLSPATSTATVATLQAQSVNILA